jgi:hypothetical protein
VPIIKLQRFWRSQAAPVGPALPTDPHPETDALDAFGSENPQPEDAGDDPEEGPVTKQVIEPSRSRSGGVWLGVAAMVVAATAGVGRLAPRAAADSASVTFESNPAKAEVFVGGVTRGSTPLTLTLSPGNYDVRLVAAGQARRINVEVLAGASVVHHVDFAPSVPVAAPAGSLEIQTEPAHLAITIDGSPKGASPLRIDAVTPGKHEISARGDGGSVRRIVSVDAGQTTSLLLSVGATPAVVQPGWLTVSSPLAMQLREGGKVIGTTEADRMMLPAGPHEIELVESSLHFRAVRKVTVTAGKTTTLAVELPNGKMNLNASPWAEVWIDGERIGETPLANISRRIGRHDVVFRHPELGEHVEHVVLTEGAALKVGVDLRKK